MSTGRTTTTEENWFVRYLKRKWLAILLIILVIIVLIQNGVATDQATVALLWGRVTMPTWLITLILFLAGGVTGWLFARNRAARKARRAAR